MDTQGKSTALQTRGSDLQVALKEAVSLWASATTSEGERRQDLLRDKQRIVRSFFRHTGKLPSEVEPSDVQQWLKDLEGKGAKPGTTYQHHATRATTLICCSTTTMASSMKCYATIIMRISS
jgi:hypothetical protein